MRRLWLGVLVATGVAAAALAPTAPPTGSQSEPAYRPVSSAVLACPAQTGAGGAFNVLQAMVAGPAEGYGTALLRPVAAASDLVRLDAPGEPVALGAVGRSQPPIMMQADGSWAPSAFAGIAARQVDEGPSQGLSSAACPAPGPVWWFVGAGSQLGRGAALFVSNAADEPARFDISMYSGAGPVQALAGKGIDLGPRSAVRLRLDALAPDEDLLAIEVRATNGRVTAALRDVAVASSDRARGVDFIPPAQEPGTRLVIAGIPAGDGARDVILVNPGTQFATVTPRLLTEDGPVAVEGLAAIAVPAGAVIRVDLRRVLDGRAGTLDLTSDVPVTGGARAEWGGTTRDVLWLAAVPLIGGPDPLGGAAGVPSGPGLVTTVVVAAPDGPVAGTLTVTTTASDEAAALSGRAEALPTDRDRGSGKAGSADLPEVLLPGQSTSTETIPVNVPAGSQLIGQIRASDADAVVGLTTLSWRSDPDSGPAAVTHQVLDESVPLATGYPWWPIASSVTAVPVREDLGVLAPAR
ncbi:MAG: DUF5719 family protein [Actinomycetota bacterium]|nr:DUF5719 family protein [Actinomycetota bacterium]